MPPSEQNQLHVIGLVDDVILGLFFVPGFDRDPGDAPAPARPAPAGWGGIHVPTWIPRTDRL